MEASLAHFRNIALTPILLMLGGCGMVVLDPSGDVAIQQRDLLAISVGLMLLIIVPVMALTVLFAIYYRHSNKSATYDPEWSHSTQLELVIWAAPLLIIICLGAFTWVATHLLDPYRPLNRISASKPITGDIQPMRVDVVALDWKWLFIYPEYGVATVNELAAPVDRPIDFHITSHSVMNSFYVPALAGQIYAMPLMETRLSGVINKPGAYKGFSANYSGAGFSGMKFTFHGLSDADFANWIAKAKSGTDGALDRAAYAGLASPTENDPVRRFGSIDPALFNLILQGCAAAGDACMAGHMMSGAPAAGHAPADH